MNLNRKIRVGISHGDINGIGYEVIMKALEDATITELCTPIVYGSAKALAYYRKALDMPSVDFSLIQRAADAKDGVNNLVEVMGGEEVKIDLGTPTEASGKAALAALERAADDLRNGFIDVLVTAPINKDCIQSDEFHFPGHTEFLEQRVGEGNKALMILFNSSLRVALVTTHLPIAKLPEAITKKTIIDKLTIFDESLRKDFNIIKPRIAVLSLNPHAGENGMLGNEEKDIIAPAIEEAYNNKILAFGPYAADGFFGSGQHVHFDGVLAMYHDQGLAPFKTIAMDEGVNFTAGLPYVRTSPDHGTGYDIAGQNKACEASMRTAIYSAIDIFRSRTDYYEMRANPLRRQYVDKSGDKEVLDLTKDDNDDTEILNA